MKNHFWSFRYRAAARRHVGLFSSSFAIAGAFGLGRRANLSHFLCLSPCVSVILFVVGFKNLSGIFNCTSGHALVAKIILKVSSSQIFANDDKFVNATDKCSVVVERLSKSDITCSLTYWFCGWTLERTWQPVRTSSSGLAAITVPSSSDWWSITHDNSYIVLITASTSVPAMFSQDFAMCLFRAHTVITSASFLSLLSSSLKSSMIFLMPMWYASASGVLVGPVGGPIPGVSSLTMTTSLLPSAMVGMMYWNLPERLSMGVGSLKTRQIVTYPHQNCCF